MDNSPQSLDLKRKDLPVDDLSASTNPQDQTRDRIVISDHTEPSTSEEAKQTQVIQIQFLHSLDSPDAIKKGGEDIEMKEMSVSAGGSACLSVPDPLGGAIAKHGSFSTLSAHSSSITGPSDASDEKTPSIISLYEEAGLYPTSPGASDTSRNAAIGLPAGSSRSRVAGIPLRMRNWQRREGVQAQPQPRPEPGRPFYDDNQLSLVYISFFVLSLVVFWVVYMILRKLSGVDGFAPGAEYNPCDPRYPTNADECFRFLKEKNLFTLK